MIQGYFVVFEGALAAQQVVLGDKALVRELYYCTTVLLYYCTTVLLYSCTAGLRYFGTAVLLYFSITVLLC